MRAFPISAERLLASPVFASPVFAGPLLAFLLTFASVCAIAAPSQAGRPSEPGVVSIPLLPPVEVSASDARIAAQSQAAIASSALIYGYALDSSYAWKQIACPVAPHHLLLAYQALGPGGLLSQFTAVVPREPVRPATGASPAQIVPIKRFGVTPFLPADKNPHTLEVFNRAVAAAPSGSALAASLQRGGDPLLLRGLCYLAMIGEAPTALRTPALTPATMQAPVPTAAFLGHGETREVFSTRSADADYQVWTLTFTPGGRLLKTDHVQNHVDIAASEFAATIPAVAAAPAGPASAAMAPAAAPSTASLPTSTAEAPAEGAPLTSAKSAPAPVAPVRPASPSAPVAAVVHSATLEPAPPQPPGRLVSNPPPPPSRFIPDAAMSYPPRAAEK